MKTKSSYRRLISVAAVLMLLASITLRGQFWDSGTGLLQMPSADMNRGGTIMITNNLIN